MHFWNLNFHIKCSYSAVCHHKTIFNIYLLVESGGWDIKQSLVWWANSFYWAFYSTQPKFFPFFLYLWQSQSVYHHCCCKIKNKNWNNLVKISKTLQHKVFFMVCFRILSEVCQSLTLYFCRADCWNSLKTTGWVEVFYDFIKRKYKSQGWQLEPSVKRGSERDVNFGRKPCECKSLKIYSKCTI